MPLLFQDFQPLAAIATTPTAAKQLQPLWESGAATLWIPEAIADQICAPIQIQPFQIYRGSLQDHLKTGWSGYRGFVFCLATGAVVRLIAPLLQDKSSDPAVVVVDGSGQFVISLCSGHQGGADLLASAIALQINATPILTGGANALSLPGIDVLGTPFGWRQGSGDWTGVSAAIARQEPVQVIQEAGSRLWQAHLPAAHSFQFINSESASIQNQEKISPDSNPLAARARIWISPIQRCRSDQADLPAMQSPEMQSPAMQFPEMQFPEIQWHPRVLWIGIGCERGTSRQLIETAIQQVCRNNHLAEAAIAGVATLDLKADESGLVELCRDRHWPLHCFSAEALRPIAVLNPSAVVEAEVGTPSVAEAAAILATGSAVTPLRVFKQIFRQPQKPGAMTGGAVTVAIAQAETEYTGRSGKLWLVGTGPGQLAQITPAAQTAIAQADVVIGYGLYVELVSSLLRPGQIVEALPITQERQRAERAIALAQWGLTVAVISSGDCGIYGMAGLVLEQLQTEGWDGKTPEIQVFPGITALQAAASRVGAPLMHDFCAISLSDLLTPWTVIEKRLTAAAQADFVTALYNPRSQTRTQQIAIAQQIFLTYRDPQTPVAVVHSAYRTDEQITLTTLAQLLDAAIDMLTIVLIGNQSTRTHADWMITPRGYSGFQATQV